MFQMRRNSILQGDLFECFICHSNHNLQLHHIFFGTANRKLSDEDGCWCWLCANHHTSSNGVHRIRKKDLFLKIKCQRRWMDKYNKTEEEFIERYGRSWLNEDFTG